MVATSEALDGLGMDGITMRARFRVIAPSVVVDDLPPHLRTVVDGINQELDVRVFEPMLNDPKSAEQAVRSLALFAELWPALLSAIGPWLMDQPDRAPRLAKAARDAWSSDGPPMSPDARRRFAAAQETRSQIASLLAEDPTLLEAITRDMQEIAESCVIADFAILYGIHLMHAPNVPQDIANDVSRVARNHAANAYALASKPTTDHDLHDLTEEVRALSTGIKERTRRVVALADRFRKQWRARQ